MAFLWIFKVVKEGNFLGDVQKIISQEHRGGYGTALNQHWLIHFNESARFARVRPREANASMLESETRMFLWIFKVVREGYCLREDHLPVI